MKKKKSALKTLGERLAFWKGSDSELVFIKGYADAWQAISESEYLQGKEMLTSARSEALERTALRGKESDVQEDEKMDSERAALADKLDREQLEKYGRLVGQIVAVKGRVVDDGISLPSRLALISEIGSYREGIGGSFHWISDDDDGWLFFEDIIDESPISEISGLLTMLRDSGEWTVEKREEIKNMPDELMSPAEKESIRHKMEPRFTNGDIVVIRRENGDLEKALLTSSSIGSMKRCRESGVDDDGRLYSWIGIDDAGKDLPEDAILFHASKLPAHSSILEELRNSSAWTVDRRESLKKPWMERKLDEEEIQAYINGAVKIAEDRGLLNPPRDDGFELPGMPEEDQELPLYPGGLDAHGRLVVKTLHHLAPSLRGDEFEKVAGWIRGVTK